MDEMTCEQCRDMLPWYAADQLSDGQRAATERHLASCEACRRELEQWRAIRAALHAEDLRVPVDATATEGWANLQARLPAHSAMPPRLRQMQTPQGSVPMDHDDLTALDGPTSEGARSAPPPPASAPAPIPQRRHALPAVAATLLVVALGSVLFAALGSRRVGQLGPGHLHATATATPATTCTPDRITAELPQHVIIDQILMLSTDDGWAVGSGDGAAGNGTLILHYSHCQWKPTGESFPNFNLGDIAMATPDEGWASGVDGSGTNMLLLHYAGGRWQQMPTPADPPKATATGQLLMHTGREGWVIVRHPKNAHGFMTSTLYHYMNGVWSPVAIPPPMTGADEVALVGPDDAWIAGDKAGWPNILAHYQHGHWTTIAFPDSWTVSNPVMSSPQDGWAAGYASGPTNTPDDGQIFLLHFDGTSWSRVDLPANIHAAGVQLLSADDRWAVALTASPPRPPDMPIWYTTAVWHYLGGQWQPVQWPFTGVLGPNDVTRVSDDEYWATAYVVSQASPVSAAASRIVMLHYLNGSWTEYG